MTSITGHCPTCEADRNAEVIAEHEEIIGPTEEEPDPLRGDAYRILKCKGCNTVYFQRERLDIWSDEDDDKYFIGTGFEELKQYVEHLKAHDPRKIAGEDTSYWPTPSTKREHPQWLSKLSDRILIDLLNSVYKALEVDLKVLAAIGMRTVFQRASELIGVAPNPSFARTIEELYKGGHIGNAQKEFLEVLTDAGGAAAHRGWAPNSEELNSLASFMEHFVRTLILKEEAGKMKRSIPPRQKQLPPEDRDRKAQLIAFPPPKPPKELI
jgi:Domain of unknown function (DUF4145)